MINGYEVVIGLEVHVELATKSKVFCSCSTAFGAAPNTQVCPVCTGMPGTLPVLNEQAVNYAIAAGLATHCQITPNARFDRKNYFYPDLPKAYQISQLYLPLCRDGFVEVRTEDGEKRVRIHEIHLEEDAGKLMHDPWDDCTLIDYNRCGVPLIEIVSEPDLCNAAETLAYLETLRATLQYLGVSDVRMEQGSLRADINLSVRKVGQPLGTRTEMKNMNSFKAIGRAIEGEARRQIELIESGRRVVQETRRWDENKDASFAMRSKENAQDYRYFPDPDLPPLNIGQDWVGRIAANLPELPEQKRIRYREALGLTAYDAGQLLLTKPLADLFEQTCAAGAPPKEAANWILGDVQKWLNDSGTLPENLTLPATGLAKLIALVGSGRINRAAGRSALEALAADGTDPEAYIRAHGLEMVSDEDAVRDAIRAVLSANPSAVADVKAGKDKAMGFLVGQCMKALRGKGDPALVNRLLREMLDQ